MNSSLRNTLLATFVLILGCVASYAQIPGGGPVNPMAENYLVFAGVGNNTTISGAVTYACSIATSGTWGGATVVIEKGVTSSGVTDLASFTSGASTWTISSACSGYAINIRDERSAPYNIYTCAAASTSCTLGVGSAGTATNLAGTTLYSTPYQSASATTSYVSPNTSATKQFYTMTGTGSAGASPAWAAIISSDLTTALTTPPAIGGTTPNTAAFTTLSATGTTTLSGSVIHSAAGAASTYASSFTGTVFTGGTATTTFPLIGIIQGATAVSSWSTSGTEIGINAVASYAGNFLDFHVNGGSSVFSVSAAGTVTAVGFVGPLTGTASLATNLTGTTAYSLPYQSASATTGYASISGLVYASTSAAPAAATSAQVLTVIGSGAITSTYLSSTVTASSVGAASTVPILTYDAAGRLTAVSSATVIAPAGTLTGTTLASNVVSSSLTSVGTLAALSVSGTTSLSGTLSSGALGTAISGTNYNSNARTFVGSYYNGSAATADTWSISDVVGTGTTPTSYLTYTHSGSTGTAAISVPAMIISGMSTAGVVTNSAAGVLSSSTTLTGLTSVTSTTFVGALTGNATTATTATNLSGTTVYSLPYQSASATTGYASISGLVYASTSAAPAAATSAQVLGVIGTSAITNSYLANSTVTIGSTSIALGATATTIAGLTSVTSTTFVGALTGNATTATSATTAGLAGSATTVTCTTTCTFTGTSVTTFNVTLSASVTTAPSFTGVAGALYTFNWTQNATGGYTCMYPTGTVGASPCYTVASGLTSQTFLYNGSILIAQGPAIY